MHDLDVVSSDSAAQFRFCILMLCMLHLLEDAFDGRQSVLKMLHTTVMHVFIPASCCLTAKSIHGCRARLCMSCVPGEPGYLAQQMTSKPATLHGDEVELLVAIPQLTAHSLICADKHIHVFPLFVIKPMILSQVSNVCPMSNVD